LTKPITDLNLERIYIAARLEKPDQVPVDFFTEGDCIAPFVGLKEREYYFDPQKMLSAQLLFIKRFCGKHHVFNVVPLPRPDYSVIVEITALGGKARWPEDSTPFTVPLIKKPEDIEKLEVPDCTRDGLMPFVLETIRYMQEKVGKDYIVGPPIQRGIPTFAAQVRGINEFLVDLRVNPSLSHKLLKICLETEIEWCKILQDCLGENFRVLCCDDVAGFFSLKMFEEFALPYNKRLFELFKHPLNLYHNDADTQQLLDGISKLGAKIFHMGPPETCNLAVAKRKIGNKICLMGNVAPFDVLRQKTPAEVEIACKECFEEAAAGGGYILSSGGVLNRGTPPENIDTMIASAEKYGKY
jgi:uroporphyrinogen decarboxylase